MGFPVDGDGALKPSQTCLVCGQPLDEGTRVDCRKCGTPHHRDCWRYNRGCAVFGCGGVAYVAASAATYESSLPSSPSPSLFITRPVVGEQRAARRLALALVVLILAAAGLLRVAPAVGALPIFLAMMLAGSFKLLRYVHEVDPVERVLRRRLHYGRHQLTRGDHPVAHLDDVVEIHHHDFRDRRGSRVQQVWLALTSGERLLLAHQTGYASPPAGQLPPEALAERLAKLTDSTVRCIEVADGPTRDEILAVAEERVALGERDV